MEFICEKPELIKGTFMWAVKQMKQGKQIKRAINTAWFAPPYVKGNQFFDYEDVIATDWEIIEEPKQTLSDKMCWQKNERNTN